MIARALAWLAIAAAVFSAGLFGENVAQYAVIAVAFAVVGLSLNVLIGYLGQLSLGHQGFVGIGAMMAAYVSTKAGWPFPVAVAVGGAIGGGAALVLGLVALRIRGLYLALVTLVFGLTLQSSLFQVPSLTNGGAGQPANRPDLLASQGHYYYACLCVLALVLYADVMLMRTKAGRALMTVKSDERVAAANGINVVGYKLLGFVLSGVVAGFGGALLVFASERFSGNNFDFLLGLTFVLMTVVGGAGSREGVVLASVFFALLTRYLPDAGWYHSLVEHIPGQIGTNVEQFGPIAFGALLLLLTLTLNPGGIAQQIAPVTRWITRRRTTTTVEAATEVRPAERAHAGA
jgi:branched-chain amino acid transport system permease protein